jgi:hypothetical protein
MIFIAWGADFEARSTSTLSVDLSLDLVSDDASNLDDGADISFWIKDQFVDVHNVYYANIVGDLSMSILMDGSNVVSLKNNYKGEILTTDIYTSATHRWINIQIFIVDSTLIQVLAWDYGNFSLEPKVTHTFTTPAPFTTNDMILKQTSVTEGVLFAEIRVFRYVSTFCSGSYFRNYDIMSTIPANMIKYARISNAEFYLDAHHALPASISISGDQSTFGVDMCAIGYKLSAVAGT